MIEPLDREVDAVAALAEAGLRVTLEGRLLMVDIVDDDLDGTVDAVRDTVVAHGLGLARMEQGRHRMTEIFRDEAAS